MAAWAEAEGIGLLNRLALPGWLAVLVAVAALDLAIWAQHRLFHAIPPLWRLHRMHHADRDLDVTTGIRFHPLEILLSMAIKLAVVLLLGAPAVAVLVFEVLLNATAMFSHANLRLSPRLDRGLRLFVVTPTCTACTIRSIGTRPTATSASTCPGGTGCSAPIAPSRATDTWA